MNRENTGNIADFGIFEPGVCGLTHCNCTVLLANSLLNRTGKYNELTGNISHGTGSLNAVPGTAFVPSISCPQNREQAAL
jgi:hypothetical protein